MSSEPTPPPDHGLPDLPGRRLTAEGLGAARFQLNELLGEGSTGQVYGVHDHSLERALAVKVLSGRLDGSDAAAAFLSEARVTAAIHHPNVLPVHDMGMTADGRPWFSMPRIAGRTLGTVLAASTHLQRDPLLPTPAASAGILINVCNAIAAAHHRHIVHQDLKPDNILLGDFGEVQVLDWGAAASVGPGGGTDRIYGTPLYMAPEQARHDRVDERSDVYGLGATLFHCLMLRPPTVPGDDAESFWTRKRMGDIDAPTTVERLTAPAPLLAIALRALAAAPEQRYPDVMALRGDLIAWQNGLAVSAWREPLYHRVGRWHRQHARWIWPTCAGLALVTVLVGMLWGERLRQRATWGEPIIDERFDDDSYKGRWAVHQGNIGEVRDGRLVTTHPEATMLFLRHRFAGPVAIEYEGEILPDSYPCDLSVIVAAEADFSADGTRVTRVSDLYKLQLGAYDNTYCAIIADRNEGHLALDRYRLTPGKKHHIRAEITDELISVSVDGKVRLRHKPTMPLRGGYIGLYGYYPGKAFDNIRVQALGIPERVSATAIGDHQFFRSRWGEAAEAYALAANSLPDRPVGQEARYRQGLCHWQNNDFDGAQRVWSRLSDPVWRAHTVVHVLDRKVKGGAEPLDLVAAVWPTLPTAAREHLRQCWIDWSYWALRRDHRRLPMLLVLHDQYFSGDLVANRMMAEVLLNTGRHQELIARFPEERNQVAYALLNLNRQEDVVRDYPDILGAWIQACVDIGELSRAQARLRHDDRRLPWLRLLRAEAAAVAADLSVPSPSRGEALLYVGRAAEALPLLAERPDLRDIALLQLRRGSESTGLRGRLVAALDQGKNPDAEIVAAEIEPSATGYLTSDQRWLNGAQAVDCAAAGDLQRALAGLWIPPSTDETVIEDDLMFSGFFLAGILAAAQGDRTVLRRDLVAIRDRHEAHLGYRPSLIARCALGEIDAAAFLAQPVQLNVQSWLAVTLALRAELAGSGTVQAWTVVRDLPAPRFAPMLTPIIDRVALWKAPRR